MDGVNDICTKEEDINFVFTGFSVSGAVSAVRTLCVPLHSQRSKVLQPRWFLLNQLGFRVSFQFI